MANHLSALGFKIHSQQEFGSLANYALQNGVKIESMNGDYVWWSPGRGIELWFQINQARQVIGMNPHFSHNARMVVGLTKLMTRPSDSEMEGAFHSWANPDENYHGDYPFLFDAPDFDLHRSLTLPTTKEIQIAAFAHQLTIFANEADFQANQFGEVKVASQSFIPIGPSGEEPNEHFPQAQALLTGIVKAVEQCENPFTRNIFYWAKIHTLGGEVNMVADPDLLASELVVEGVVQGVFWLSGRIQP